MKKIFLLILGAIALSPAPAKAVDSDVISYYSDRNAALANIGAGDVACAVDDILAGATGWSACYSSTWSTQCLKNGKHCELCFVEDPEICQFCGAGWAVVDDEGNVTGNHCEQLNSAGCLESFPAYENCAKCASNGTSCTKCNTGYTAKNGLCVADSSASDDSGNSGNTGSDDTGATADTNTILGNCPTGTTKSADGCCCMPN